MAAVSSGGLLFGGWEYCGVRWLNTWVMVFGEYNSGLDCGLEMHFICDWERKCKTRTTQACSLISVLKTKKDCCQTSFKSRKQF